MTIRVSRIIILGFFIMLTTLAIYGAFSSTFANAAPSTSTAVRSSCITYDPKDKMIKISCGVATLSDIDKQLRDPDILSIDHSNSSTSDNIKTWLLNAGVMVGKGASLNLSPEDVAWIKIVADGRTAHPIQVVGNLKVDSVKITSWNPKKNDYLKFKYETLPSRKYEKSGIDEVPRPYIIVQEEATGTANVTNSELGYLGYACGGGCSGLSYYGGQGSIIKGNHIHHNRFGFYSNGVSNILLEDNLVDHNYLYGFDPHTGTHDMTIRNNTVHDHGAMGIICSLNCYNIIVENNTVSNSHGSGIMFSRNMSNSVARNNYVYNETNCIFVSQSHNNEIYYNRLVGCDDAIHLFHKSSNNVVHNNSITDSGNPVNTDDVKASVYRNKVYSNSVTSSDKQNERVVS
ncbi:MAG TPA: NosD domain-containing protein [Nitrososphaeraceae archaeon]|nr:NosD domain-containing protein [Nitrososphaeraceae archaeon]